MSNKGMSEKIKQGAIVRGTMVIAALVIIIAGMREASAILVPFLVAVFIAVIGAPAVFWLKNKGVRSSLAVLLVVLAMLGVGFGVTAVLTTSLNSFYQQIPSYQDRLEQQKSDILVWLQEKNIPLSGSLLWEVVNPGAVMQLVAAMLGGLGGVLKNAFLITLTVIFILLEASSFPAKLRAAKRSPQASFPSIAAFTNALKGYLAIKTVVSLITGILAAIWVAILGLDFPLLWGLLAFLFNYVPTIGSILAAVPPLLLALIQLSPASAVLIALGYLCINFIFGSLIEPRFMSRGLGLSTLVVFLSLVFWGWVLGPVGMLLSVPLTMTAKIGLESHEETQWIAILLSSEKSISAANLPDSVSITTQQTESSQPPASSESPSSHG